MGLRWLPELKAILGGRGHEYRLLPTYAPWLPFRGVSCQAPAQALALLDHYSH